MNIALWLARTAERYPQQAAIAHGTDVWCDYAQFAERALAGDALAKQTLIEKIYKPLAENSVELLETLIAYLDCGRSLEATSKQLFVHANTVRYRLKRISEIIGWDATGAHEAFVLQVAMVLGSMSDSTTEG